MAGASLSYNAIAALDRAEISADGRSVWIGGHHRIRIDPNAASGVGPVEMWERWHMILHFCDRYPSTPLLAEHLQRNMFPDKAGLPHRRGPVAIPIDRWSHLPLPQ